LHPEKAAIIHMSDLVPSSVIIHLIQQDLKHAQMMEALKAAGFQCELHFLDLATPVAQLMGNVDGEASDQWAGVYVSFLEEAIRHENLAELAEECYLFLRACGEIERRCTRIKVK
jgi:hypothetical protein